MVKRAAAAAAEPALELPAKLAPQLATLATAVPTKGQWAYEIRFDGYRILARVDATSVRLFTRMATRRHG